MKIEILGVKIDNISLGQSIKLVDQWLSEKNKSQHYIVTPNPEFIVAAQDDQQFKKVLNKADLAIPDGAGLKLSVKINFTTPGTDLMAKLIELSNEKAYTIGFLGGSEGVAAKLKDCLLKQYPNLKVNFCNSGGKIDKNGNQITMHTLYSIPTTDILFVAFGHIKQEKWIYNNLTKYPVKVMMGVGGAFDYLSGEVKRAPEWVRKLGLEWLYRLINEPWRFKRQLKLLKYVWLILKT